MYHRLELSKEIPVDNYPAIGERRTKLEEMTRLELMTLLLSLEALLEEGKNEKALEVIKEVLEEARKA